MNILKKMISISDSFTKTEREIFEFVKNNMDIISRDSTALITEKYGFSQPALTRFSKKLGYSGYSEFKYEITRFRMNKATELKETNVSGSYLNAFKVIDSNINFTKLLNLIKNSRTIVTSGYHRSKVSAQLLAYNLTDFKYHSFFMAEDEIFKANSFLSEEDLIIIFSSKSQAYFEIMKSINEMKKKPKTVLITQSKDHPLIKYFSYNIVLPSARSLGYDFFMENNIIFSYFITQLMSKM